MYNKIQTRLLFVSFSFPVERMRNNSKDEKGHARSLGWQELRLEVGNDTTLRYDNVAEEFVESMGNVVSGVKSRMAAGRTPRRS